MCATRTPGCVITSVYRDDANGITAAASYDAVVAAERDPELFSNAGGIRPETGPLPQMIDMDDPQHLTRRRLVNAGFTRKKVEAKAGRIREICDQLIDAVCEKGEADFVADLAAPLPMAVIGDMLGVRPEERALFLRWSDDLVKALGSNASPDQLQAMMVAYVDFTAYMMRTIAERRSDPADDLVSTLIHSAVDGEALSDQEIVNESLLILIGGDETTRHVLSGGMEQLLRHPDQRRELVDDPDTIPLAMEEMLRWSSPIKNMARTMTRDTDFFGAQLKAGEKMLLLFESANFDESVFLNAERFDIGRTPNPHVPSASERISVWVISWPGSRDGSCSSNSSPGCRTWNLPPTRRCSGVRPTSCPVSNRCRCGLPLRRRQPGSWQLGGAASSERGLPAGLT